MVVFRMIRFNFSRMVQVGLMLFCAAYLGACALSPQVYSQKDQAAIDRRYVEYPAGFVLTKLVDHLDSPNSIAFDTDGTLLIAEAGIDGAEPRILYIKPNTTEIKQLYPKDQRIPFSPFQPGFRIYGPVGGMVADKGRVYVSHRDANDHGVITQFTFDGKHKTIQADLPAMGDFGVTDLAIGPKDRLYFGIGSATNSGIVGPDNLIWLRDHREFCDQSYVDLELLGLRFIAKNPFAGFFGSISSEIVNIGPYQLFGTSNLAHIQKAANGKPNSAVCSVSLTGGDFEVDAYGIRLPRGIVFNEHNAMFVSNNGMALRGLRPVFNDPDSILRIPSGPALWFGFPDYTADLLSITDKQFQPPVSLILPSGFPKLASLIDIKASGLREIDDTIQRLVKAKFQPLSGAAKMAFAPSSGPLKRWQGELFVALSGDRAPFATSGEELKSPVGFKIVRVNVESGKVDDFIHNTKFLPASKTDLAGKALERPCDVKIGPDGSMYILDFGHIEYKSSGKQRPSGGTGAIYKLSPEEVAPPTPKE